VVVRLERLERLANVAPGSTVPAVDTVVVPAAEEARPAPAPAERPAKPPVERPAPRKPEPSKPAAPTPAAHAADADNVDVAMLRRSWPSLIEHLGSQKQMILRTVLESATVAAFDGATLQLAFPPDRKFGPQKVDEKRTELRSALRELFGIEPEVVCVVRELRVADPASSVELVDEEDEPNDEEALRRLHDVLGAQPIDASVDGES
jgi:hypothetical protein